MLSSHGAPIFGADRIHQALTETADWLESLVEQTAGGLNAGARLDELIHAVRPPAQLADRVYLRAKYDGPRRRTETGRRPGLSVRTCDCHQRIR